MKPPPQRALTRGIVAELRRRLAGRRAPLLVALDGGSGAGKTTLAAAIAAELGATVVEADDFFANDRPDAAWEACPPAERAAQCLDWRRLRAEALQPLLAGRAASWHPFDVARPGAGVGARVVTRRPAALLLLEGVYSSRPELAELLDLTVLVDTPAAVRARRHDAREARDEAAWHRRWDSAEAYYFARVRPRASFDLVVTPESGRMHVRVAERSALPPHGPGSTSGPPGAALRRTVAG